MIGPKKLDTIRKELHRSLTATGDDPIEWLEKRMTAGAVPSPAGSGESPVLASLLRILGATKQGKLRTGRTTAKKSRGLLNPNQ